MSSSLESSSESTNHDGRGGGRTISTSFVGRLILLLLGVVALQFVMRTIATPQAILHEVPDNVEQQSHHDEAESVSLLTSSAATISLNVSNTQNTSSSTTDNDENGNSTRYNSDISTIAQKTAIQGDLAKSSPQPSSAPTSTVSSIAFYERSYEDLIAPYYTTKPEDDSYYEGRLLFCEDSMDGFRMVFPRHRLVNISTILMNHNISSLSSSTPANTATSYGNPNDIIIVTWRQSCTLVANNTDELIHWLQHNFTGKVLTISGESYVIWPGPFWDRLFQLGTCFHGQQKQSIWDPGNTRTIETEAQSDSIWNDSSGTHGVKPRHHLTGRDLETMTSLFDCFARAPDGSGFEDESPLVEEQMKHRRMRVTTLLRRLVEGGLSTWRAIFDPSQRAKSSKKRFLIYAQGHCVSFREEAFLRIASANNTKYYDDVTVDHDEARNHSSTIEKRRRQRKRSLSSRIEGIQSDKFNKPSSLLSHVFISKRRKTAVDEAGEVTTAFPFVAEYTKCSGRGRYQSASTIEFHTAKAPDHVVNARMHQNKRLFGEYRFCLCMENKGNVYGYITEKLLNAFLAGCIPIYYGSPIVFEMFNPKSFIFYNVTNETAAVEAIALIHAMNVNETLFDEMLAQPILRNGMETIEEYFSFAEPIGNATLMKQLHKMMGLAE